MPKVIRNAFVATFAMTFGCASATIAQNSCANVITLGSYDQSGLTETADAIYTVGTFRIEGEKDESKQPMFNLTTVSCEKRADYRGKIGIVCRVTQASVLARSEKPDPDSPNCSLDLDVSEYEMKELQGNVLTGMEPIGSTSCYDTMLTVNRNTKRVYRSFTRTAHADKYDKIMPNTCGAAPAIQVLMNCTAWPKLRRAQKQGETSTRYCDFSNSSGK